MPICHSPLLPYCSISHILFTYTTQRLCPQLSHSMSLKGISCKYNNVDNIKNNFLLSLPVYKITLWLDLKLTYFLISFSFLMMLSMKDFNVEPSTSLKIIRFVLRNYLPIIVGTQSTTRNYLLFCGSKLFIPYVA